MISMMMLTKKTVNRLESRLEEELAERLIEESQLAEKLARTIAEIHKQNRGSWMLSVVFGEVHRLASST